MYLNEVLETQDRSAEYIRRVKQNLTKNYLIQI